MSTYDLRMLSKPRSGPTGKRRHHQHCNWCLPSLSKKPLSKMDMCKEVVLKDGGQENEVFSNPFSVERLTDQHLLASKWPANPLLSWSHWRHSPPENQLKEDLSVEHSLGLSLKDVMCLED